MEGLTPIYETVMIVDAMIPDESIASEFEAVEKFLESRGKVIKVDRWGKRKLAYPIRKRSHGEYTVFYYNSDTQVPSELDKRFRINENVLRWMTVKDNPCGIPEDRPEDGQKAEESVPASANSQREDEE